MIFRIVRGQLMLTMHMPNETPKERAVFFLFKRKRGTMFRTEKDLFGQKRIA